MNLLSTLLLDSIIAGVASTGFAVLFNVPTKTLPFCAFTSFLGYITHLVLLHLNLSPVVATFFASLIIGIVATIWSTKYSVPRPAYTVASILPMFPGKYAYLTIMALLEMSSKGISHELTTSFIQNSLTVVSIVGAISLGLVLPSLYFIRHDRPVI